MITQATDFKADLGNLVTQVLPRLAMLTLLAVEGHILQNIGYVDCVSLFYRHRTLLHECLLDLVYPIFEKETLNISAKNTEFTSAIPQQIFVNSKVRAPAKPSAMTMTFF